MHSLRYLDIIGSIFAFLSTYYYIKANKLMWPIGLIAICMDGVLFLKTHIYGDAALEIFYLISTFYGWYQWTYQNKQKGDLPITRIPPVYLLLILFIASCGIAILSQALIHFTNSKVPYLDAITTVLSIVGQWMLCRKYIESWFAWFVVDAIYVGLYLYKGIPAHSILLVIYLIMAVIGYFNWRRIFKAQEQVMLVESVY